MSTGMLPLLGTLTISGICMNWFTERPMKVTPFMDMHGEMYSMLELDDGTQIKIGRSEH